MSRKPKYSVGDWVVVEFDLIPDVVRKVVRIDKLPYDKNQYWTNAGTWFGDGTTSHLWTIDDAKDGDLLATDVYDSETPCIIIFKRYERSCWGDRIESYCSLSAKTSDFKSFSLHHKPQKWHPVTEDQRELFFSKLNEAGCEWDAKKKEMRFNGSKSDTVHVTDSRLDFDIELPDEKELSNVERTGKDLKELTEFEDKLLAICLMFDANLPEERIDYIKDVADDLLSVARKQIASEVDVEKGGEA